MLSLTKDSATESLGGLLLLLPIGLASLLALLLEGSQDLLVLPADLVGETAKGAEATAGLQTKDSQGSRDNHALGGVVGLRDTLEDLETLHGSSTTGSLVGEHATDDAEEDTAGSTEMEGTVGGVNNGALAEELVVLHYRITSVRIPSHKYPLKSTLGTEEGSRHVHLLGTDNDDTLAVEDLLGNDRSKTTEQVALTINNDNLLVRGKRRAD